MIRVFGRSDGRIRPVDGLPADAGGIVWVDLRDPTREEELAAEELLGVQVPTRQELAEIEESSRLYAEAGTLVMTAVVISGMAEGRPERATVTFILTPSHLVTVRYLDPTPFRTADVRLLRQPEAVATAMDVFVSLLESIVERVADVLEQVSAELNDVGTALFWDDEAKAGKPRTDLQQLIRKLGRKNQALIIIRESLHSLSRLIPFLRQGGEAWISDACTARLKATDRDLRSLSTFESQLEQQIAFLHEATVGLIGIEQNAIIKVFSVAAVLFLPPTLVGTVYGMNFEVMPELHFRFGYPLALLSMIVSALIPYWWFKRRGWL
jgi:magnesium transporter